jgi:glycosyltransferase involved in cell wall biosynthesis
MKKIFILMSAPQMYGFLSGHPQRLKKIGYQAVFVSSASDQLTQQAEAEGATRRVLPIEREISPWKDLITFFRLCWLIGSEKPAAILSMGPKANFLGNTAAWVMGVPLRISLYVGIRQETMSGWRCWLVDTCDRIAFASSTAVIAISRSLRQALIQRGLVRPHEIEVTGNGTTNGIPEENFPFNVQAITEAQVLQRKLSIPCDAPVLGFVGRLTEDKGLIDLLKVYQIVRKKFPQLRLILVGPDEIRTKSAREALQEFKSDSQVHIVGSVGDVQPYIHLFWVHLFPTYREGFGNATAEAAALAVPTVGYKVTGVLDSVDSGKTGFLSDIYDYRALAQSIIVYLTDAGLRARHGLAARQRTLELFHPEVTWNGYLRGLGETYEPNFTPKVEPLALDIFLEREKILRGLTQVELNHLTQEIKQPSGEAGEVSRTAKGASFQGE